MHRIAEALAGAETTDVDVGPLRWRLGLVRSEDLIRGGLSMLSILPSRVDQEQPVIAEEAARAAAGNTEAAVRMRHLADAMICAAVRQASHDAGATWEPLSLVLAEDAQDPAAGRVWVASLPIPWRDELYHAAMRHNTGDGRVTAALATFRGGPDRAAPGGPAGAEVRTDAA